MCVFIRLYLQRYLREFFFSASIVCLLSIYYTFTTAHARTRFAYRIQWIPFISLPHYKVRELSNQQQRKQKYKTICCLLFRDQRVCSHSVFEIFIICNKYTRARMCANAHLNAQLDMISNYYTHSRIPHTIGEIIPNAKSQMVRNTKYWPFRVYLPCHYIVIIFVVIFAYDRYILCSSLALCVAAACFQTWCAFIDTWPWNI